MIFFEGKYITMGKTNQDKSSPEIVELRKRIELKSTVTLRTPADFIDLSELIADETGEILSPTTLKRLWGYIEGAGTTRLSTLNILSKYIGFSHWEEFQESLGDDSQSSILPNGGLDVKDLEPNDLIAIEWLPNRKLVVRYCKGLLFEVVSAENSKVKVGDTFECSIFILHEPLYVANLIHGNNEPVPFVMGAKDGLTKIKKIEKV
ncbi:MAG: hypothetical protein MJZ23_06750 [Paludibacteraceae bacterium]|nr:hypothetical protein [Paludibacteraceae bacterium]